MMMCLIISMARRWKNIGPVCSVYSIIEIALWMGGGQDGARGQLASQCVDQVIDSEKGSARNPTLGMGDTSVSANPIKIIIVLEGGATKQIWFLDIISRTGLISRHVLLPVGNTEFSPKDGYA